MTKLEQKTFMGASIRGFNSNVGWGSTSSTLTVDLVVDAKNGDNFVPIPVGLPAYFEYYDYYFGGIVQKYEQQNNTSGSPLFSVVLQDTKEILQGVQIITNKYYGSTYGVPNVYNVYGYYETNSFGSSLANDAGMPWKLVRDGFTDLVKTTPINYRDSKYIVDFSNLDRLPNYYRIGGESNITAFEFISRVCQDSALDFYLKLLKIPIGDAGDSSYYNTIKLFIIDRSEIPKLGKISEFINSTQGAVSKSIGVEFRNENNNKFLVGGQKLAFYGQYRGFDYGRCNRLYNEFTQSSLDKLIASSTPKLSQDACSAFFFPIRNSFTSPFKDEFGNDWNWLKVGISLRYYSNPFCDGTPLFDCGGRDYFASEQDTPFKNYFSLKFHPNPKGETAASYFYSDYIMPDGDSSNIGIQQYMGLDDSGNACLYKLYERQVSIYDITKLSSGVFDEVEAKYIERAKSAGRSEKDGKNDMERELQNKFITFQYFGWNLSSYTLGRLPYGLTNWTTDFEEMEAVLVGYNYWKSFLQNASQNPSSPHWNKRSILGWETSGLADNKDIKAILTDKNLSFEQKRIQITNLVTALGGNLNEVAKLLGIPTLENMEKKGNDLYNILRSFAEQYWGKKFMVKVPQIQVKIEPETNEFILSHTPVNEGYVDESEYLEAILRNIVPLCSSFKNDGKILAFLRFDYGINLSLLRASDFYELSIRENICNNAIRTDNPYSIFSNGLYEDTKLKGCGSFRKATVEQNLVFINAQTAYSPRAILSIQDPVTQSIGLIKDLSIADYIYDNMVSNHNLNIANIWTSYADGKYFMFPSPFAKQIIGEAKQVADLVDATDDAVAAAIKYLQNSYDVDDSIQTKRAVKYLLWNSAAEYLNLSNGILAGGGMGGSIELKYSLPNPKQYMWPAFAGVPLLSNVDRYGPWYNVKALGGTAYEKDDDLVPWKYGGYTNLNNIARAKVDYAGSPQQESESGTIEFPGIPKHSIGDLLVTGGPYINGITVSFNNGGVKTTYRLETWSPQFGNIAKAEIDRANRLVSYMNKNDRLISTAFDIIQKSNINQEQLKKILAFGRQRKIDQDKRHNENSPVGFIKATSATAGYASNSKTSTETKLFQNYYFPTNLDDGNYQNLGYMSLDGVFRPFSTDMTAPNSSGLPHFEFPSVSGIENRSIYELNPFPSGSLHDVNFIARGNELVDDLYTDDAYTNILKGVGLRAPIVLVGWGYDTDGNPVPNSGIENDGVANQEFMYNHYKRADKWKAGPLDVAWDDARKVWTAVGGGGIFLGKLTSPLNYRNVGTAALFSPSGVKENGEFVYTLSKDSVQVVDWLLPSGGFIGANTDVILGKNKQYYFVIGQACGPEYFNTTVY